MIPESYYIRRGRDYKIYLVKNFETEDLRIIYVDFNRQNISEKLLEECIQFTFHTNRVSFIREFGYEYSFDFIARLFNQKNKIILKTITLTVELFSRDIQGEYLEPEFILNKFEKIVS